ncbi:SLC13 family permease [Haladaptatus sp. AB643]|uniref:SLC13 family permease n=1 Tax=unclassified Haladaptatus TaxID=2622732 RepID=UPI00209C316E|nr:SLC13 family permease [Haladaptatus sp. AB643]MCO8255746.1 SLC13 family permease [Haladaptatus sp. AB618]
MLVVFGIIALALFLFVTELLPIDVTAILVMVLLMFLNPWTQVSVAEGISGFSNTATVAVLAMLILSTGISQTGLVQIIGKKMAAFAGNDQLKQLVATISVTGPVSGFINNTPVVAILVPVISDLAHEGNTSPSKLLIPLSYASMFGGMLTLIGTSTNLLASSVSERLIGRPFSMFTFTGLGVIVLLTGSVYLLTIGHKLIPERVPAREDYLEEYDLQGYVFEVVVRDESPLIGKTVQTAIDESQFDTDIVQLSRDNEQYFEGIASKRIRVGDILTVRTDRGTLNVLREQEGLDLVGTQYSDSALEPSEEETQTLVEIVIQSGSSLLGETIATSAFRERYDASVLAFRSGGKTIRSRLNDLPLRVGDTLLVQAPSDSIDRLSRNPEFIVAHESESPDYRTEKIPWALGIIIAVVGLVGMPWDTLANVTGVEMLAGVNFSIVQTALAGVVLMVVTDVIKPGEIYEGVDWSVIFLLAGVIPLGVALEQTGAANLLGSLVAATADFLPLIGVLWVFYIATGLITSIISNNASVVLMIPVAVEAARDIGGNPFAFILAVTFAASTAFITPVGYQTNLFVYGPGGYKFTDYARVGAPLQLLLSVVTILGIAFFWGVGAPA